MAMRSDAFANVSRIVEAARKVFAGSGDGSESLNHIAKVAGVGVATLYRHFPNRQALAHAVYDRIYTTEVEPLITEFARADVPREALLDVAERLCAIIVREKALVASLGNLTEETTALLARSTESIAPILWQAQDAGNIRADIGPDDIPHLLAMVAAGLSVPTLDDGLRRRYLGLLLDALNPARATTLPSQ
ncbi:transcriptional regulator [Actinoplanes lobatus]|uniref:Transcriptional regulator n=1 Tax=Actinoplanes lobatus TaxID=113568 RepID=A0A7W7MJ84_9ACTN|nr:TetR/AcrR family transcriptional regulator [Actinoplanes lobatus]MBB4752299.1 AcrR family transcriptional regulator [Actinoplanes lobatus]GGN94285.1 transcriptional regulator [Actinoplanes lobatus]GIE45984.1 transcriptional regulator [Actinoplanes lobatus]